MISLPATNPMDLFSNWSEPPFVGHEKAIGTNAKEAKATMKERLMPIEFEDRGMAGP